MMSGFLTMFFVVFFGIQLITKTGIFWAPGVVMYDGSVSEAEREFVAAIFDQQDLPVDVKVSARNVLELPELAENEFLFEIYVPVTDFYDFNGNILVESADQLLTDYMVVPIGELGASQRLLSVNGKNYLEEFNAGAVFRIISFEAREFAEKIRPLVAEKMTREFPSRESVLTFAQTGVTALSRGMNAKLGQVGDAGYFSEKIAEFLSSFDLTHTSNESSFTDYATSRNICSDKRFINTLLAIGLDIVELTGNHNQDCGDVAASETIDVYTENNIRIVGGGKTADEAARPLEIEQKGSSITMLAYNLSTGGATYDATPGANQYYEEVAARQIAAAKERGDFVIMDVQYYECNGYASTYEDTTCDYADSAAGDQVGFFRHLIDLGADVVVGTSAHQPQTFELYGNGAIYYGLGNLFFDQVWWPGTTRSLVLAHYFYNGRLLQTRIVPTVYDANMQTAVMNEPEWFLERLAKARPQAAESGDTVQAKINAWAAAIGGAKGVILYDLDAERVLGEYNADKKFATASLYKLFVVYEGYRRVQSGEWDGDAAAGKTGQSIRKCLDLAIRESYSPCAETLWDMIGPETLDEIVLGQFGINLSVEDLVATPREIMRMMRIFYKHNDVASADLVTAMWDSFLNQPVTTYDWRQGLPSGFSGNVLVYNKVGWDYISNRWNVYDDAAILDFTQTGRHFILVVMTNNVGPEQIRELGRTIERLYGA